MAKTLLQVDKLEVQFKLENTISFGVRDISFSVKEGVNLALIGESGCGKSVTALSCMRLLGSNAVISNGNIIFEDKDITRIEEKYMEKIRGSIMSMIFQEPMTSLNPVLTIKYQISEVLRLHTKLTKKEIQSQCIKLLEDVGISDTEKVLNGFPYELSGGMCQRVMIAIALVCKPKLLIADEPTTALDVTIQAQILSLLKKIQKENSLTILIITHDFGVACEIADEVLVMYAGIVVEKGSVEELFLYPLHPYTKALIKSIIPINANINTPLYSIPGIIQDIQEKNRCPFYNRCDEKITQCEREIPKIEEKKNNHFVRCWR